MADKGIVFPEQTDDASGMPGLSKSTNSEAVANSENMIAPPAYYALQPSSTQKATETVSTVSKADGSCEIPPGKLQQTDAVLQQSNMPSNTNRMLSQQDQSLHLAQRQRCQKLQCQPQPKSGPDEDHKHRNQPDSAHASLSQPVKLQRRSAEPSSRLATMRSA